jgi:cell wall-associated NlpC family hydrolase
VRFRALGSTVFCMLFLAGTPVSALAITGGVAAGGAPAIGTPGAHPNGSAPPVKRHTAPVTSHSTSLIYSGPVYEKTTAGQIVPFVSAQASSELKTVTGGSAAAVPADTKPELLVPGHTARVVDGLAAAPMSAPAPVQQIVWAGNQIIGLPYIFGGGHASFSSPGYDCSGTVSFALHGASLLATPEDSSEFMGWGSHGVGTWVTIFTNPGHAYMTVAGLRLDTSAADDPTSQQGPRWRPLRPANSGFTVRHPTSL